MASESSPPDSSRAFFSDSGMAASISFRAAASFARAAFSSFSWRKMSISRLLDVAGALQLGLGGPFGLRDELALGLEDLDPGQAGAGHQDDECHVLRPRGGHRGDQAALAVADRGRSSRDRSPFGPSGRRRRRAHRRRSPRVVELEIEPVEPPTPRSSTRSTAIPRRVRASARTRNGLWPRMVSSRSCAPDPVSRITAGKRPVARRHGQRAGQLHAAGLVLVRDLLGAVRERRLRRLGPGRHADLIRLLEDQRQFQAALGELALEAGPVLQSSSPSTSPR